MRDQAITTVLGDVFPSNYRADITQATPFSRNVTTAIREVCWGDLSHQTFVFEFDLTEAEADLTNQKITFLQTGQNRNSSNETPVDFITKVEKAFRALVKNGLGKNVPITSSQYYGTGDSPMRGQIFILSENRNVTTLLRNLSSDLEAPQKLEYMLEVLSQDLIGNLKQYLGNPRRDLE